MFSLSDLCTERGITEQGWAELERIAEMRVKKHYKEYASEDYVRDVMVDGAEFLLRMRENAISGAYPEPRNPCAALSVRARNAASNLFYHRVYKPQRAYATGALARELLTGMEAV